MSQASEPYKPGMIVKVIQQIPHGESVWTTEVRGTVVRYDQAKTGSWYAHAKDRQLWLDRLTLRRDDGEIVELVLDGYTHVEVIDGSDVQDAA